MKEYLGDDDIVRVVVQPVIACTVMLDLAGLTMSISSIQGFHETW